MWYILLVSLVTQCLATQVTYHTTSSQVASSASSSDVQKNDWSWQEPLASASNQNENYHPLSFSSADASQQVQGTAQQQYTANIQTQASGVTQVVDQHAQQSADSVIDDILVSNRQGRNLEGYEELYADPKIKNALQIGNDTIARTYIRDKLCTLGLMNCDGLEERRPYYSPHRDIHPQEVIYAQPVTIKPVGRPLPAIAVKRPYGPAKPVPLPPGFGSGPPFSHHFSGPPPQFSGSSFGSPPSFSGPHSFSGPSSSFGGPYPAHKKPSIVHGTRPVYESGIDGEYDFENKFIEKKQVIVQQPTASGVQQHVHHHFHHGEDDNKTPNIAIGSPGLGGPFVNPGIGSHGAIGSNGFNSYGYGSGGTYGNNFNDFEDYKKNFKVKSPSVGNSLDPLQTSSSYANRFPSYVKPKGDSILSNKGFSNGGDGLKVLNSGFGGNNFGNTEHGNSGFISESFNSGSNNFGTNGGFGNNGGLGSSNGYGSNTGLEGSNSFGSNTGLGGSNSFGSNTGLGGSNGFVDNGFASTNSYDDCICVPYDQCAGLGQAGRKDDLFLAIDPRNLGKNIEAETVDVVLTDSNGTMSVVRVPKGVNETEQAQHSKEQDKTSDQGKTVEKSSDAFVGKKNDSKRAKRDVKHVVEDKDKNSNAQGRLSIGDVDTSKLNFKPTWGVSFGLPQNGGGNYPINPYGSNPVVNPYPGYGSGTQGINLGLVSVNPLVALQVTKDDYGDKVIKPFVNLHVTPNHGFVHKLSNILAQKKEALFGGGHGGGYYPGGHYAPSHHYPYSPQYPNWGASSYYSQKPQQHQHHHLHQYQQQPYYEQNYNSQYGGAYNGYYREDRDYDDSSYFNDFDDYGNGFNRNARTNITASFSNEEKPFEAGLQNEFNENRQRESANVGSTGKVTFRDRRKRETDDEEQVEKTRERRQFGRPPVCGPKHVCCRRNQIYPGSGNHGRPRPGQCGVRNSQGINGRIKTPVYVDGDSEFGEYPWQVAILKKDPSESVYVCGGTLISPRHIMTAAHCVKTHGGRDLRARLGEWDVNHDVEFYPYIERDIVSVHVHPEFYAGTLYNDVAILKLDHDVDFEKNPHISPACLPDKHNDFNGARCWTTGWGKDAFGDFGKYQNILKEVDVPVVSNQVCEHQMRRTRLGPSFNLHPGFICAGGEEGKDACKGDGGGPMVCERHGKWQLAGIVSWGIGCGQPGVPGVYSRVSYYLDWVRQIVDQY